MIGIVIAIMAVLAIVAVICAFAWYRIPEPSEAHLVVTPTKKFVVSPDQNVSTNGKKTYFAIPSVIPYIGRAVRAMDVTIKELVVVQETYEKGQARYNVKSSLKYRIVDVETAAETFIDDEELQEQLKEVVRASVRAVTVKYNVVDARANKQAMADEIQKEMDDDLDKWGLRLINFQLVDFQDTDSSKIISDISRRREVEIAAETREQNAEKIKQARVKEAEAEEKARQREIEKEKVIGEQEQLKAQKIAEMEKEAKEKEYNVIQVATIRQAKIDKEKAIVKANEQKEQEAIYREKKKLEGEGDRLRAEEQAKGEAAPILQKGLAEAEAKEALQEALNKFGDDAIRALVAEQIVEKDRQVGIETAQALKVADLKVFSGGNSDAQGFDLGKMISSMSVADNDAANSFLNKMARPNDLGMTALGANKLKEEADKPKTNADESRAKKAK
jgi:flotillin